MHRTVLDLGETYRGQTVHIRFRVGSDRNEEWEIDNVEVSGVRRPPFTRVVANRGQCLTIDAGADQIVDGGELVTLAGSHGDTLTAAWTQVAGPAVALASDGAAATFTAPVPDADTELRFRLTVRPGGHTGERSDEVVVRVRSQIVVATLADRRAVAGAAVALDASASHGAADDELTYAWRQDAGPAVTLTGADTAIAGFAAPAVTAPSTVTLTVTVGSRTRAAVASRAVSIEVLPALAVWATASLSLAVPGQVVRLTATTNRAAGDAPVLRWEQVEGPAVVLDPAASEPEVAMPAPAVHSALRFRATATGTAFVEEATADVVVIVAVTDAGADREAVSGAEVVLGSEQPDGLVPNLVYRWEQTEGPPVTLRDPAGELVRFAAPTVTAETRLAFRLAVQSGEQALGSDEVAVTVRPTPPGPGPGPSPGPEPGPEPEPEPEDGGCGCSTSGSGAGGSLALGLAIVALLRRRRR